MRAYLITHVCFPTKKRIYVPCNTIDGWEKRQTPNWTRNHLSFHRSASCTHSLVHADEIPVQKSKVALLYVSLFFFKTFCKSRSLLQQFDGIWIQKNNVWLLRIYAGHMIISRPFNSPIKTVERVAIQWFWEKLHGVWLTVSYCSGYRVISLNFRAIELCWKVQRNVLLERHVQCMHSAVNKISFRNISISNKFTNIENWLKFINQTDTYKSMSTMTITETTLGITWNILLS